MVRDENIDFANLAKCPYLYGECRRRLNVAWITPFMDVVAAIALGLVVVWYCEHSKVADHTISCCHKAIKCFGATKIRQLYRKLHYG